MFKERIKSHENKIAKESKVEEEEIVKEAISSPYGVICGFIENLAVSRVTAGLPAVVHNAIDAHYGRYQSETANLVKRVFDKNLTENMPMLESLIRNIVGNTCNELNTGKSQGPVSATGFNQSTFIQNQQQGQKSSQTSGSGQVSQPKSNQQTGQNKQQQSQGAVIIP